MNNPDETVQKCNEILDRLYERRVKQAQLEYISEAFLGDIKKSFLSAETIVPDLYKITLPFLDKNLNKLVFYIEFKNYEIKEIKLMAEIKNVNSINEGIKSLLNNSNIDFDIECGILSINFEHSKCNDYILNFIELLILISNL